MNKQVTVATQTGHESPDLAFNPEKMTTDKHCYECKVRYKDPKPQDLVMYLHAWKYKVSYLAQSRMHAHPRMHNNKNDNHKTSSPKNPPFLCTHSIKRESMFATNRLIELHIF